MVAPDNPFLIIVPDEYGKLIDREEVIIDLEKKTMNALDGGTLILFSAGYGMGKSIIKEKLKKKLKRKVKVIEFNFTNFIADDIRNLPFEKKKDILVIIERFDLIEGMSKNNKNKILNLIIERNNKGLTFLLLCTPDVVKKLFDLNDNFEKRSEIVTVSEMTFEEARQMVVSRLNTMRKAKSGSIEPFTEFEMTEIWKKSKGNPRMILLLCASLYDRKMVRAL